MCMDDDMIVEAMASGEESKHYQRYVSDRFVVKDIEDNQIVMGYPAVPLKEFLRKK